MRTSIASAEDPIRYPLYTAEQSRIIDRYVVERLGIPGYTLMQRAGKAAFDYLHCRWLLARRLCIVCGSGNNGGDGLVVARLARKAGLSVRVVRVGGDPRPGSEAAEAQADWRTAGGEINDFSGDLPAADLYVDALFGTGLSRPPEGAWAEAISLLAGKPVFAIDVPSGLDSDTGAAHGVAVRAEATISFIVRKRGLYTGMAPELAGEQEFASLDVPGTAIAAAGSPAAWLQKRAPNFYPRPRNAHKGDNGRVLVVGSAPDYPGAARLCGEAALRAGAGLVTIGAHPDHAHWLNVGCWELIVRGLAAPHDLERLLGAMDVLAIGPGLGQESWGNGLWQCALNAPLPLVVDADALNLLAQAPKRRGNWILTPHPGEAARLLGITIAKVQADRFRAVAALAERYDGAVILKGAGTLIHAGGQTVVCAAGNPGMASAGMGDVLTGVIAALLGQGMNIEEAASTGVCLHAQAGDEAALEGERGLLASDLIAHLRQSINRGADQANEPGNEA